MLVQATPAASKSEEERAAAPARPPVAAAAAALGKFLSSIMFDTTAAAFLCKTCVNRNFCLNTEMLWQQLGRAAMTRT
eukprot:COSAG05_NODE_1748_length_4150_cov_2.073068_3_plen_78_part_00